MSAFLFKQTETAGTDCACGAQTFGRGTGPAARARQRLHKAGLSRAEGGARPWPRRRRGKGWQRGGTGRVRREAQPLPRQALEEPHTVPELL